MRKLFVALVLFLAMTPFARSQKSRQDNAQSRKTAVQHGRASSAANAWVEQKLKGMTVREKLGQLLMPVYFSVFLSTESPEYRELVHQVEENHIGGLIVGTTRGPLGIERSQVWPTAVITNQLQSRAKIPLLIGADFESGSGMRLDEGTSFPSAMAVGATGDPRLAYETGKITALEARAAGVQWIFAPDSDVNSNPDNPIINIRSYSEDPDRVADFVAQFVRGVEENGALATAKHFPGHGNVNSDSHLGLPTVPGTRQQLETTELAPFRAAIQAGAGSVMPGHLFVPSFEPDAATPATLSQKILTGLLRDEMHFQGLIVTDAMDMGGVTNLYANYSLRRPPAASIFL
jgi:beta-N-acetylhexosaminidase